MGNKLFAVSIINSFKPDGLISVIVRQELEIRTYNNRFSYTIAAGHKVPTHERGCDRR